MIRPFVLLTFLAFPAFAQDADPQSQLVEGYIVCAMAGRTPDMAAANLGLYGWTHEPAEDGMIIALPGAGEASFVLMAEDGSFCHVESLTLGTDKALETFALAMPGAGLTIPDPGTDAMGCALYDLGLGMTATLTSGGNDPTCTSPSDSAIRFDFAPAP